MRYQAMGMAIAGFLLAAVVHAQPSLQPLRLGVLNDQTGPYADQTGAGSALAARMAVEDFGPTLLGRPIEVLVGDHQNKPDVGSALARQWFDRDGVDMIVDVPTSSVALAVQEVARQAKRIVLFSGSGAAELTGEACAPLSAQWTYDTYAMAAGTGAAITRSGADTWYVLAVDYSFGAAMTKDLTSSVTAYGGKVLGSAKHPLGTSDFASYLLKAQASGAKVIGLVNAGRDTSNAIKQAAEFGIAAGGQKLAGMVVTVVDIKALGLDVAQGLQFTESFYWDMNDATRAWAKRFFDKQGRMPTMTQAGVYSATLHWLRSVKAAGTADGTAVAATMRRLPVEDMMTHGARIRADGRLMRDFYLFEAKRPSESKGPWDLYKLVRTIPAEEAARPASQSACPLLKK
jgi:branched-chain amino acid transport system substrate-binding protein